MNKDAEILNGIKWYFDCKKLALSKIFSFHPPANIEEIRMTSGENFFSFPLCAARKLRTLCQPKKGNRIYQKLLGACGTQ